MLPSVAPVLSSSSLPWWRSSLTLGMVGRHWGWTAPTRIQPRRASDLSHSGSFWDRLVANYVTFVVGEILLLILTLCSLAAIFPRVRAGWAASGGGDTEDG